MKWRADFRIGLTPVSAVFMSGSHGEAAGTPAPVRGARAGLRDYF